MTNGLAHQISSQGARKATRFGPTPTCRFVASESRAPAPLCHFTRSTPIEFPRLLQVLPRRQTPMALPGCSCYMAGAARETEKYPQKAHGPPSPKMPWAFCIHQPAIASLPAAGASTPSIVDEHRYKEGVFRALVSRGITRRGHCDLNTKL